MKKSSAVNLTIVCFLLTLCITSLIVIYATAPETALVLFEEDFDILDDKKWTHQAAECNADDKSFHYVAANDEHRYTSDGILHFFTNHTEDARRTKRGTQLKCNSCINWQNGVVECFSSKYSARLQTRASFYVKCGQIEVRSRLPTDLWINLTVLIVPTKNNSGTGEALGGFVISRTNEEMGTNCSADVRVFFGPGSNQSVIKSAVTDRDFHLYKMEWDDSKILFTIDRQTVFEKVFQAEENYSCSDEGPENALPPINQPIHIKLGVDVGGNDLTCNGDHSAHKRSLTNPLDSSTLDVDYVRFSKIYNNIFNLKF